MEIPVIAGNVPEKRKEINAVGDNSGKFYIFGASNFTVFFVDMIVLNVVESSWSISYPLNAPKIAGYSATLLSNGIIVYIGGYDGLRNVDILQINPSI